MFPSYIQTDVPKYQVLCYVPATQQIPNNLGKEVLQYVDTKPGSLYKPPKEIRSDDDLKSYPNDVQVCGKHLISKWPILEEIYKVLYLLNAGGLEPGVMREGVEKDIFGMSFKAFYYYFHPVDYHYKYALTNIKNSFWPDQRVTYWGADGSKYYPLGQNSVTDFVDSFDYTRCYQPLVDVCTEAGYVPYTYIGCDLQFLDPFLYCECTEDEMITWCNTVVDWVHSLDSDIDIVVKYEKYTMVW